MGNTGSSNTFLGNPINGGSRLISWRSPQQVMFSTGSYARILSKDQ